MSAYVDATGVTQLTADIKALADATYATKPNVATISVPYSTWSGYGPYTQTVTISGATITANTRVDIQPDETAFAQMILVGCVALFIKNTSGTLTIYAIGGAPTDNLTLQVTYYETA